jgi:HlyD family secretion protein
MRARRPGFRLVFWSLAAAALAGALAFAFWPRPLTVEIAAVSRGPLTVFVRDEGRTRVREVYQVSAPLAGRLSRIGNRSGEAVQAGDIVAAILPADPVLLDDRSRREAQAAADAAEAALVFAQADLDQARAVLANAETEAGRAERLRAREAISQSELDRARLALRSAQAGSSAARARVTMREAELAAARVRLIEPGETDAALPAMALRAPVTGRILRVMQESEAVVAAGSPVMEIGDPADLEVVAEYLSSDAVRIAPGAEARIEAWGGSAPLRGRVRLVEPSGFLKVSALGVEEQRVNVVIDLLDPREAWSALGHGYRVEAATAVAHVPDGVLAPVAALFRRQGDWAVFAVDGGRARLRPVSVGANDGRMAEITDGLAPGDAVILHPGGGVGDGVRVTRRETD